LELKMRKTKLFILIILLLAITTGCTKATIKYEIDKKYNVSLNYHVNIDLVDLDQELKNGINNLARVTVKYYQEMGFIANTTFNDDNIELDLTLTKANNNYEEAFQTLNELLTNPDISFLLSVDQANKVETFDSSFSLDLKTDLSKIISATGIDNLPLSLKTAIDTELAASEVSLEFILPYSTVIEKSESITVVNDNDQTYLKMAINLDEPSEFNIVTRMSLDNGKMLPVDIDTSIIETQKRIDLYHTLYYVGLAFTSAAVISFVILIVHKKAKKTSD